MTNYCCKEFSEQAENLQAPAGGGLMYPSSMREDAQFLCDEEGWHIKGCCGDGCFVVTCMKFCPYCGTKLPDADATSSDSSPQPRSGQ